MRQNNPTSTGQGALLTGGSGFVGRAVYRALVAAGYSVYLLVRQNAADLGERQIHGDLSGSDWAGSVPWDRIDVVVHLAAAGVKVAARSWPQAVSVNVVGTQRLLNAVSRHAVKRPLVLTTRTFYEDAVNQTPELLDNPYIATKVAATEIVREWADGYPGRVRMARIFQVYGPLDNAGSVLTYAAKTLRSGVPATFGSGTGKRDWIHVADAAAAIVNCLDNDPRHVMEYDIGSGFLHSLKEVVLQLAQLAAADLALITFDPSRDRSDTAIAIKAGAFPPGWQPKISLQSGLNSLLASL